MSYDEGEYQKMLSDHLAVLTNDGKGLLGAIQASAALLKLDFLGKARLSGDEKEELLNSIIHHTEQIIETIDWSIKTRQEFKKLMDNNSGN